MSLKEQAEALASCLRLDIAKPEDVAAWADRWIATSSTPIGAVCDASLAKGMSPEELISVLHEFPGPMSSESVHALICARLRDSRVSGRMDDEQVASALCRLGVHHVLDGETLVWSGCFEDELEMADRGILREVRGRSREDVLREMGRVLDHLAGDARWESPT